MLRVVEIIMNVFQHRSIKGHELKDSYEISVHSQHINCTFLFKERTEAIKI